MAWAPPGLASGSDVRVIGATELAGEFTATGAWATQRSWGLAYQFGKMLIEVAQQHASGRPGPNIVSGEYVGSFYFDVVSYDGSAGFYAGSDAPQAMRLEYGFVGTDSRGRIYNQPPYPHWGPAIDEVAPLYEAELYALTDLDVVRRGV